jgi:hypothetical protein
MTARRQWLLGAALAATLGASWWASTLEEGEVEPAAPRRSEAARPSRSAAPAAPLTLAGLDAPRPPLAEAPGLFQPRSLQPPPPPAGPPPKPHAPPLPFRFMGAMEEGKARSAFLLEGNQVRVVQAGDLLGSQYRVDSITATAIEFTYLPLKERQTMPTTRP